MTTQPESYTPNLRELIQLEAPTEVRISPDGEKVAILVRTTNWKEDRYETVCRIAGASLHGVQALTRSGSVLQAEWFDDQTLGVLKKDDNQEAKAQVFLFEGLSGEGWQVTDHKGGVEWFKPFAGGLIYLARHPERQENKPRSDHFGTYTHFEQEPSTAGVYYIDLKSLRRYETQVRASTKDEAKKLICPVMELTRLFDPVPAVKEVVVSPTGDAVYLNCWLHDDIIYYRQTSVYVIELDPETAIQEYIRRETEKLAKPDPKRSAALDQGIEKPAPDEKEDVAYIGRVTSLNVPRTTRLLKVSPDGQELLFSYQGRDEKMYTIPELWVIERQKALQAATPQAFTSGLHNRSAVLDEEALDVAWVKTGLFASYPEGTVVNLARLEEDGHITNLDLGGLGLQTSFDIAENGRVALIGSSATHFPEVYLADTDLAGKPQRLTDFTDALAGWELGSVETIRWRSRDGVEIEGVLRKPANFDPAKKYPLVFVVHGGPTWFSTAYQISSEELTYYPVIQFLEKDVLVLKPNYRGSTGRGQAFMELNVNNLGVGDLWDLESAIDHLVSRGWVDPERVGCMGWSQGGYISAFVGLHSERFKAVSVGAGISDWYTYHISNDIPDFTTDYLSGSPFRDRELYIKTAPISNLTNAKTPMLIQHGSEDQRVPVSNATELYRGLKEMGVPVELFIFPGMAHPITKPRENHAVMHQNLTWFSHYLLGDDLNLEQL